MSFNNLAGQIQHINTILPSTTADNINYTLTSKQSGSVVFIDENNFEPSSIIRLPPPNYGLNFKFINKTNLGNKTMFINSYNNSNVLTPLIYRSKSITNSTNTTLKNKITITFSSAEIGDEINFICDGTHWYVNGIVATLNTYN